MSVDRKQFLELVVTGGLGALFGGSLIPGRWKDKGVTLIPVSRQSVVMGSMISFQVTAESESAGYETIRRAEQIFRSLEKTFSMYDEQSEMARLAARAGKNPVSLSGEALDLLRFSKQLYRDSDGKFDITIEPAMRRWGFRDNPGEVISTPTDRELRNLERIIGSDKIDIEDNKAFLEEEGMAIDTGGVAGGYALDKAIEEMKKCDISSAFINFSGDIHCFGSPLEKRGWPVHILDPRTKQPRLESIDLYNEALSTSGAYQNRRHGKQQQSWGHLFLPAQAEPLEPVGSVTVVGSSALRADAWSTASYVGAEAPRDLRTIVLGAA